MKNILLVTIATVLLLDCVAAKDESFARKCDAMVTKFLEERSGMPKVTDFDDKFVFFLHVPRTAGKTYANCFLRAGSPVTKRCSPSYDFFKYNVSQENCRHLWSHDDFSAVLEVGDVPLYRFLWCSDLFT